MIEMETDPDPYLDRQALDADPYPGPSKRWLWDAGIPISLHNLAQEEKRGGGEVSVPSPCVASTIHIVHHFRY